MSETDENVPQRIRTSAVRTSATEFGAKVDAAMFALWLKTIVDDAFESGYTLALRQAKQ